MPPLLSRFILALVLLAPSTLALGQAADPPATPPATEQAVSELVVTSAQIEEALAGLTAREGLDEATRKTASDLYAQAQEAVEREKAAAARLADLSSTADSAAERLAKIRAELDKPAAQEPGAPPADAPLPDLVRLRDEAQAALSDARSQVDTLATEANRRDHRRTEIPNEISAARKSLSDLGEALASKPAEGEAAEISRARRLMLLARRQADTGEIAALEAELSSYDARRELIPARRDAALRRVSELEKLAASRQVLVSDRTRLDAEAAAREASRRLRETAASHPALVKFAEKNKELAATRTGPESLPARSAAAAERLAQVQSQLSRLRQQFRAIRSREDVSGLDPSAGLLLRQQRGTLLDPDDLRKELGTVAGYRQEASLALFKRSEERLLAGNIDEIVQSLVAMVPESDVPEDDTVLRSVAMDLATARRDLLDKLVADAGTAVDELAALEAQLATLRETTAAYRAYVDERILWVRGVAGDTAPKLGEVKAGLAWLLDRAAWAEGAAGVSLEVRAHPLRHAIFLAGVVISFLLIPLGRWRLRSLAALVRSHRTDRFLHTFRALLYTCVLAVPLPILLTWIAWLLALPEDQPPVVLGVASGLREGAWFLLPMTLIVTVLRRDGLGDAHFRWPTAVMSAVRRDLALLVPPIILMVATANALGTYEEADIAPPGAESSTTLGRLAFSLGLALLLAAVHVIARPGGPAMVEYYRRNPGGWLDRLRRVWYPLLLALPIGLILATWVGYYYSATQIALRLDETIQFGVALVIVNTLLLRWLFIARRRLAIEDARRRREQAEAEVGSEESPGEAPPLDVDRLDLPAIGAQTRQLIRAAIVMSVVIGLYGIWADVLPALRALDRLQVWPEMALIERDETPMPRELDLSTAPAAATTGETPAPAAEPGPGPAASDEARPLSITVADIGLALLALLITWIAARNVPGLVGIVLLQRLPLDAGSRYAIDTVLRYVISVVGIIVTFGAVGITWVNVQWLAAALTFGLAFGLQEIFANFVSGLIILGERPFRVGDTITVNNASGTVSRIRMRATTIVDWDRKELVIPNKTFVTGDVTNWTLSDAILRVTIPVGVSYSSDVEQVTALLLELAKANPMVLDDPPPRALFLGFGDSTLDFQVRVFIGNVDHLLAVKHELHIAIIQAFREAGIEIAFPQRDLHLRSTGDLAEIVRRDELAAGEFEAPAT